MGVFAPIVRKSQGVNRESSVVPSDRIVTPANIMTALRPVLGGLAAWMFATNRRGATAVTAVAAATDNEGLIARLIDKRWPNSGLGSSTKGKLGDPIADSAMLFEVAAGTLISRRAAPLGKVAMGIILAQEGVKAKQASAKNSQYTDITGTMLDIPITMRGKEAMAEKLVGASLAAATHEITNPVARTGVGAAALYFAVTGVIRGHKAHQDNMQMADNMIAEALLPSVEGQTLQPDDGGLVPASL